MVEDPPTIVALVLVVAVAENDMAARAYAVLLVEILIIVFLSIRVDTRTRREVIQVDVGPSSSLALFVTNVAIYSVCACYRRHPFIDWDMSMRPRRRFRIHEGTKRFERSLIFTSFLSCHCQYQFSNCHLNKHELSQFVKPGS